MQGAASASEAIIWTVSDIGRDCGGRDALTSEIPFSCVSFLSLESYHVLQYIVLCTHGRCGGGRRAAEEVVGLELSSRPAKSGHGGSSAADLRRVRSYHVSFEVWTGPMAHGIITLSRSLLETFLRRPLLWSASCLKKSGRRGVESWWFFYRNIKTIIQNIETPKGQINWKVLY